MLLFATAEFEMAMIAAVYAIAGLFSYPVWQSETKWGLAAVLFPAHSLAFWFLTSAAKDLRFVVAPVVLIGGGLVAMGSEGDAQVVVGLVTAVLFLAICFSGKDDKSSLL